MFPSGSKLEVANFLLLICTWIILWSGVSCRVAYHLHGSLYSFNGGRKTLELASSFKQQNDVEQRLTIPSSICRIVQQEGDVKDCFGVLLSSRWLLTASCCAPRVKDNSNNHVQVVCGTPSSSSAFTHNEFNVVEIKPLRNATAGERQATGISLLKLDNDAPGPYVKFKESDGPDFYILEQSELMKTFFNISGLRTEQTQGFWQKSNNALGLPLILNSSAMRNDDRAENSSYQITTCCLATACQLFKDGITRCNFSRITPTEHKSICRTTEICNEVSSASSMTASFHSSLSSSSNVDACLDGSKLQPIRNCLPVPPFSQPCCSDETLTQPNRPELRKELRKMVISNNVSVLEEWILCSEFNINARDKHHETLLHDAAWHNSSRSAKVLCELGIDTELKNKQGKTALLVAANRTSFETLKVILNHSANVDATDNRGRTSLHFAAFHNSSRIAEVLCDRQIDVEAQDDRNKTALIDAAKRGSLDTLKVIVNSCKNVNVNAVDNAHKTALHYATKKCNFEMAQLLVNHHANCSIVDKKGNTPHDLIPSPSDNCQKSTTDRLHNLFSSESNQTVGQAT